MHTDENTNIYAWGERLFHVHRRVLVKHGNDVSFPVSPVHPSVSGSESVHRSVTRIIFRRRPQARFPLHSRRLALAVGVTVTPLGSSRRGSRTANVSSVAVVATRTSAAACLRHVPYHNGIVLASAHERGTLLDAAIRYVQKDEKGARDAYSKSDTQGTKNS